MLILHHNYSYPFMDGQLIPTSWEEILVEIAAEILDDPSPRRLNNNADLIVLFIITMKVRDFREIMFCSVNLFVYYYYFLLLLCANSFEPIFT